MDAPELETPLTSPAKLRRLAVNSWVDEDEMEIRRSLIYAAEEIERLFRVLHVARASMKDGHDHSAFEIIDKTIG